MMGNLRLPLLLVLWVLATRVDSHKVCKEKDSIVSADLRMAPTGNTENIQDKQTTNSRGNCERCGSLRCAVDQLTSDTYCLCEDSTAATGDPPQCNHGNNNKREPGTNLGNPGLMIAPDIFANNPADLSINAGKDNQKDTQSGVKGQPKISVPMDFSGGNGHDYMLALSKQNGDCPTHEVCENVNCGEAGCLCNPMTNEPICLCADSQKEPDEFLKCPYEVRNPINISDVLKNPNKFQPFDLPGGLPFDSQPENTSKSTQQSVISPTVPVHQQAFSSHHIKIILQIAVPAFFGVLLIGIIIMILLWRRKVRLHNRKPKNGNVVSWIQKQDQVHLLENMKVVGKNPTYVGLDAKNLPLKGIQTTYIPQGSLTLMDVIGEGAFGKVYKGNVKWTDDNTSSVAVKILKEDASTETREDFVREVKIMSAFNHPNILKLIGVVTTENHCPYMVFEYMEYGDLTDLLRSNDPYNGKGPRLEIKQHELVDIATQIANGMVYLASKHFVHRDLATRNCLVGAELVVKISDFGMSRDIYTCDYYKIGGSRMLPVRWMSSESIKYGRFTTESDVWSFGVVLWEIFAFGKQPYYGHTNEEVIRLIDDGILLQRPQNCPDTVYHVILGCWRKNPKDRFTFDRIHRHMKDYNKTMVICYQPAPHMSNNTEMTVEEVI